MQHHNPVGVPVQEEERCRGRAYNCQRAVFPNCVGIVNRAPKHADVRIPVGRAISGRLQQGIPESDSRTAPPVTRPPGAPVDVDDKRIGLFPGFGVMRVKDQVHLLHPAIDLVIKRLPGCGED